MAPVTYDHASRVFAGATPVRAVDDLELTVHDGEFLVLVGPSGSGKSTALRMLAGLEDVDEGAIAIGDREVTDVPAKDRDIAMVFQSYALYPHMSVADNMAFGLKLRGIPKARVGACVREAARMLDLEPYLERKPKALSGGQRQRVAMGRAIVRDPSVFLMDEPLSNLDAKLRVETRANIAALQQRLGTTTVYVTHDQVEAMTMGQRVAVLKDGRLQQCAAPRDLYETPANAFVAGFIGSPAMNLKTLPLTEGGARLGDTVVALSRTRMSAAAREGLDEITVGVRPEAFEPAGQHDSGLALTVDLVEELGADTLVHGVHDGSEPRRFVVRMDGRVRPALGDGVSVAVRDVDEVHAFHPVTGARL